MYFASTRRSYRPLGVIGREDGTTQPAVVRQRGYVKPTASPEQIAADVAASNAARAQIAATLTPVGTTASGAPIYEAPNVASLPSGATPTGIRSTGEIVYAYPVMNTTVISPTPTTTPTAPIPSTPTPTTSDAPTTPNTAIPSNPPPIAMEPDVAPTTPVSSSTDQPSFLDSLLSILGANRSPTVIQQTSPEPQTAGTAVLEIDDSDNFKKLLVVAVIGFIGYQILK